MSNATQAAYISDASALIDTAHLCCTTQDANPSGNPNRWSAIRAAPLDQ